MNSSLSLSTLRPRSSHTSDATAAYDSKHAPRKDSRRKFSLNLPHHEHREGLGHQSPHGNLPRSQTDQLPRAASPSQHGGEPLHPRKLLSRTSKAVGSRISSLRPSLIKSNIDTNLPPIQRKAVGSTESSPVHSPPPPPYSNEPDSSQIGLALGSDETTAIPPEEPYAGQRTSSNPPALVLEIPQFSISNHESFDFIHSAPPTQGHELDPVNEDPKNNKLHKDKSTRRRSSSIQHPPVINDPASGTKLRKASQSPDARGRRSFSAQVVPPSDQHRPASTPRALSVSQDGSQSPKGRARRSWFPGSNRSRSNSIDVTAGGNFQAWVISEDTQAEYNPTFLKNAEKVPELWNENGAVVVYLYPRGSGCGPSFKVPEFTVSSSYIFNQLMQSGEDGSSERRDRARSFGGRDSLTVNDATRMTEGPVSAESEVDSSGNIHLYLPIAPPTASGQLSKPGEGSLAELDRLIGIRNLFAFLTGQPLVGTKSRPTLFSAFLQIAALLEEFAFTNDDGTTFGDAVDMSFGFYSEQHAFADCRHSREKTLEALIMGECMRSKELYNEAFAHAAGKYTAIQDLRLPLFGQVSKVTRERLERAHLDLVNRQHSVNNQLEQFDFPSMFAGVASSTSIPELKQVRFKTWRNSFGRMRQFVLGYYRSTFGNWPPKASSKKNTFSESGLNRLVLKALHSDLCALYDLLVDRTNLTSRIMDEVFTISRDADKITTSALRSILSEFDRSKPPVLPPIPFDLPKLPTMTAVVENFKSLSLKDQAKHEKKIKENELLLILIKAYNSDTNNIKLPFLDQFKEFEAREGKGKSTTDLADQRIGYWLFLYVVLQSLPMLVVDAPGLKFTDEVEYFLCEPPIGNLPWIEDRQPRKLWYEVSGGGGLVELSADAVMFSVEGTYHRSHCWLAAKLWEGVGPAEAVPVENPGMSALEPPRAAFQAGEGSLPSSSSVQGPGTPSPPPGPGPSQGTIRPRNLSPAAGIGRNNTWRSSIAMGLEPVPLEPLNAFAGHNRSSSLGPRPPSSHLGNRSVSAGNLAAMGRDSTASTAPSITSGATFDDILGDSQPKKTATKKRSRFF